MGLRFSGVSKKLGWNKTPMGWPTLEEADKLFEFSKSNKVTDLQMYTILDCHRFSRSPGTDHEIIICDTINKAFKNIQSY